MKKIMLACSAGRSTSLLVEKMRKSARERGLDVEIEALPVAEAERRLDEYDVVMLGPQIRYKLEDMRKAADGHTPVDVIKMTDYGMMNGKNVLDAALAVIGK